MRGRTNIDGGGLELNGTVENYVVKTGSSVLEGDFVQFDDNYAPSTQSFDGQNMTGFSTFSLDGSTPAKQVTFYVTNEAIKAIIETYSNSDLINSEVKTIVLPDVASISNNVKYYFVNVGSNRFLFFYFTTKSYKPSGESNYYYGYKPIPYLITYDSTNNSFSIVKKLADLPYVSGKLQAENDKRYQNLFAPKYAGYNGTNLNQVVIACSSIGTESPSSSTSSAGKLTFVLYDFVNDTVLDTYAKTTTYSIGSGLSVRRSEQSVEKIGNYCVCCADGTNNRGTVFVDTSSLVAVDWSAPAHYYFPVQLTENKFLLCHDTTTSAYIVEIDISGNFNLVKQVTLPFVAQRGLMINSKKAIGRTEDTVEVLEYGIGYGKVSLITFNSSTNNITFSDVFTDACFVYNTRSIELENSALFSTRGNFTQDASVTPAVNFVDVNIVKESNGNIVPTSANTRKVMEYINRVDGVALESGAGGDLISVVIPASS